MPKTLFQKCLPDGEAYDATYYNWKAKYGGMTVSDAKKLKVLEDENRRLKHIVADLTLDNQALKAVVEKKF